MINPLGFSLEHYDAIGRFPSAKTRASRSTPAARYVTQSGEQVAFQGVRALAEFLAASSETHACLVQQLFHHQVKQPLRAYPGDRQDPRYYKTFAERQFNTASLLVEIAVLAAR